METHKAYYSEIYHTNMGNIYDLIEFEDIDYSTYASVLRSLWLKGIQVAFEYFKRVV